MPADLVVEVAAAPRPPHRALRLGFAIAVGALTTGAVVTSLVLQDHSDELRVGPPTPMSAAVVERAVRSACAAAAAAVAPADLLVASPTAYEILAKRRLGHLGDAASSLAVVVPAAGDARAVVRVEAAIAAATTQARTALALAQAGDAVGARKALDDGATGFAAACG